jgi:hypothetical protein
MQMDVLADVAAEVDKALAGGESLNTFAAGLEAKLARKGWWQPVEVAQGGRRKIVNLSVPWRIRVIYDTNMRMARSAAIWQRYVDEQTSLREAWRQRGAKGPKPSLYLVYDAVNDDRTRPEHAAWDRIVLPLDHPFWRTHFPPNGWYCRCTVYAMSARQLESAGLKITPDDRLGPLFVPEPPKLRYNRQGVREDARKLPGIDLGFDYNVGIAAMDAPLQLMADGVKDKPRAWAQAAIARQLASPDFQASLRAPALNWVASMAPDVLKERHGKVWGDVVQLTAETMTKLSTESTRVRPSELALLPKLLDEAVFVVLQDPETPQEAMAFFTPTGFEKDRWFIVVLNVTLRKQVYLKTLHTVRARKVLDIRGSKEGRARRKYRILIDNIDREGAGRGGD